MWRSIFRPELLFALSTLQALSPYLFWQFGWGVSISHDNLTYYPIAIWALGYLCFVTGARLTARQLPPAPQYLLAESEPQIRILLMGLIVFIAFQSVWVTRVYGTLPILSYLRGDGVMDIVTANRMQETSAIGQIGLYDVSMSWMNGLVLLLLIILYEKRQKLTPLAATALLVIVAGNLINGKRQGVIRAVVYMLCGMGIYSNSISKAAFRVFSAPRSRLFLAMAAVPFIVLTVYGFGYIADIRNQGAFSRDGLTEIIAYQEYPLLNFEAQCRDAGFGPYEFNFFYPFQRMLPYKLMKSFSAAQLDPPVRVEASSPAGFYEDVQWALGPLGIIGLSFGIGMLARYFYSRALHSPPHLLIYCQMAFNLFISHSFNEFLILAYFPGVLTVFLLCAPLKFRRRILMPVTTLARRPA
jgi:oligosaccharide repeat unit polymerase